MAVNCSTCSHWSPKQAGGMAKHRMAPCALGKPWTFFGPEHLCVKHREAAADVVAARVAWIGKSGVVAHA